ncbi:MAG: hypothetical protein EXS58_02890 [Candidatus Latescibacteria bacterium]|nr:hypothetical protein [Candidatus Latescibacterota bacterium]
MKCSIMVGAVCIFLLGTTAVRAHSPEGELFFAVQFPDNAIPVMDGDISEWDIVPESPYHLRNDRLSAPDPSILTAPRGSADPSDLNLHHVVGWNNSQNKLYFMSEVFDNIHNIDREDVARFWDDDALEIEVNPSAVAAGEKNLEGQPVNQFSYKWSVPPLEGQYQYIEPISTYTWFQDGTEFIDFGWAFDGEMFGESTYYYEMAITPILALSRDEASSKEGSEILDLEEGTTIHFSVNFGDIDETGGEDNYNSFWGVSTDVPCCNATSDLVMAELDPLLLEALATRVTAVEEVSWGRIKAGTTR